MKQSRKLEKAQSEMEKFMKFWFGFCALASVLTVVATGYVVIKLLPVVVHYLESH